MRIWYIGCPWPDPDFFLKLNKLTREDETGNVKPQRKVIHISAQDGPNIGYFPLK